MYISKVNKHVLHIPTFDGLIIIISFYSLILFIILWGGGGGGQAPGIDYAFF